MEVSGLTDSWKELKWDGDHNALKKTSGLAQLPDIWVFKVIKREKKISTKGFLPIIQELTQTFQRDY